MSSFLGYDEAVNARNSMQRNVMERRDFLAQQARDRITDITGDLAQQTTEAATEKREEQIGTGITAGVSLLNTVKSGYSLKNLLAEHVEKGKEFVNKAQNIRNKAAGLSSDTSENAVNGNVEQPPETSPQNVAENETSGTTGSEPSTEPATNTEPNAEPQTSEGNVAEGSVENETKEGSKLAKYTGISEETAGKLMKGFTVTGDVADASYQIAQDLHGGFKNMDTLQKIGNVGDIAGDAADIVGQIPGLEEFQLVGEGLKLVSGLFSEGGDAEKEADAKKQEEDKVQAAQKAAEVQKQKAQQQLTQAQAIAAPVRSGLIAAPTQTIQQRLAGQ